MKLYQLEKGQKFKLDGFDDIFTYIRLDGMYANIQSNKYGDEIIYYAAYVNCQLIEEN